MSYQRVYMPVNQVQAIMHLRAFALGAEAPLNLCSTGEVVKVLGTRACCTHVKPKAPRMGFLVPVSTDRQLNLTKAYHHSARCAWYQAACGPTSACIRSKGLLIH